MSLVYGSNAGEAGISSGGPGEIYPYVRAQIQAGEGAGAVTLGPWRVGPLFRRRSVAAVLSAAAAATLTGVKVRLEARMIVDDATSAWFASGDETTLTAGRAHGLTWPAVHASEIRIVVTLPSQAAGAIQMEATASRVGL